MSNALTLEDFEVKDYGVYNRTFRRTLRQDDVIGRWPLLVLDRPEGSKRVEIYSPGTDNRNFFYLTCLDGVEERELQKRFEAITYGEALHCYNRVPF